MKDELVDYDNKKSKPSQVLTRCPNSPGAYSAITLDGKKLYAGPLSCNSWNCPYCHPRLKKKLRRRILKGPLGDASLYSTPYSMKHLTLTYGGAAMRADSSPEQAYDEMIDAFHQMRYFLTKKYGDFYYFRVTELHKDGWPHFHVLFAGNTIAPKTLLKDIEYFWRDLKGLGFVRLNKISFHDASHAINYMLKYVTKNIQRVAKHKRVFSASRGSLLPLTKFEKSSCIVYLGSLGYQDSQKIEIDFSPRIEYHKGWVNPLIRCGPVYKEFSDYRKMVQENSLALASNQRYGS